MAEAAQRVLMNEFKQLSKEKWTNIEVSKSFGLIGEIMQRVAIACIWSTQLTGIQLINDNVFEWSVALIVLNEDSLYYGGYFKAKMAFPRNYPHSPPGTSQHMSGTVMKRVRTSVKKRC
jgi:ubiquitin-conjugating enzyme E2 R